MSNRALVFTAERLLHILQSFPAVNAYMVGFSGGADSTALLHALNTVKNQLDVPISAVHVNHGLHDDADLWQIQCEDFCHQNRINLVCLSVDPQHDAGKGLEAEARQLRYAAITSLLSRGDCLLTAHHADDQAETLLLNLMRGSGVDGLSAMPQSRPFGPGVLQRPLLSFQNDTLRNYLHEDQVKWTEDPSNQCLDHDRNFIRHEVIPLLEKRWPEVNKRLLLSHSAMKQARHLLERMADNYLDRNLAHPYVLFITSQLNDDPDLFKLVVRRWIKQSQTPSIPVYQLETFYQQAHQAGSDHHVSVHWGGWLLRLYKQQLWLHTDSEILPCPALKWTVGDCKIDLGSDIGELVLKTAAKTEDHPGDRPSTTYQAFPDGEFSVGARSNMEETSINQGDHHKSLKNLFQMAGIPPWLRDCIPLCKLEGELVALGDWCFDKQFASWMANNKLCLCWYPNNPLLQFIVKQHQRKVDPAVSLR